MWVRANARSSKETTLGTIMEIENLDEFDKKVPNNLRALVGGFTIGNPRQFHHPDGRGYKFLADKIIEIDSINPQIASRLCSAFNIYEKLQSRQKGLMKGEIARALAKKDLSNNSFERLSKIQL